jgi:hypothetical protein
VKTATGMRTGNSHRAGKRLVVHMARGNATHPSP